MTEEDLREINAHRESYGKGYDDGYQDGHRAGQEAMRERAEALCRARAAEHLQRPDVGDWPVQIAYNLEAAKCARLITEMEVSHD